MNGDVCAHVGCNSKSIIHAIRIVNFSLNAAQHFCESHVHEAAIQREYKESYEALGGCEVPDELPYEVYCLLFDDRYDGINYFNAIFLKHIGRGHIICLGCGLHETSAVYYEIQNPTGIRLTHSLIKETVRALGADVSAAVISGVGHNKRFKARIRVKPASGDCEIELDARASDAVTLALVCRADILVKGSVVKALGVKSQEKRSL